MAIAASDDADPIDACRRLLNRGVLHIERREVAAARADFAECARRARRGRVRPPRVQGGAQPRLPQLRRRAHAGGAGRHGGRGRASCRGRRGPTALQDRARVLLEAGLVGVADSTLAEAAALFAEQHLPARRRRVRARSGGVRDAARRPRAAARDFALSAERRFRRRGDDAWVVRSSLLALQADAEAYAAAPGDVHSRARVGGAGPQRRRGWSGCACPPGAPSGRRPPRTCGSRRTSRAGCSPTRRRVLEELGPVRNSDPIAVRLHGRRIRAMLALEAGDRERAGRYVRAGQRDLGLHRSRFGSLDLRTAGAVHGTGAGGPRRVAGARHRPRLGGAGRRGAGAVRDRRHPAGQPAQRPASRRRCSRSCAS